MQVNLRDQGAYVGELAFGGGILVVFLFILGNLWEKTYVAQGAETLGGLTWPRMVWYVTFTEAMVLSRVNVARRVDEDVRTGDIAYALLRPGDIWQLNWGRTLPNASCGSASRWRWVRSWRS